MSQKALLPDLLGDMRLPDKSLPSVGGTPRKNLAGFSFDSGLQAKGVADVVVNPSPGTSIVLEVGKMLDETRLETVARLRRLSGRLANAVLVMEDQRPYDFACQRIRDEIAEMVHGIVSKCYGGVVPDVPAFKEWAASEVKKKMLSYFRERVAELKAYTDPKTGLFTAEFTSIYLEKFVEHGVPTTVLDFDMQGLGALNTALGETITDRVLKEFFGSLAVATRDYDFMSWEGGSGESHQHAAGKSTALTRKRPGGDEGQLVLPGVKNLKDLSGVMRRIYTTIGQPMELVISESEWAVIMDTFLRIKDKKAGGEALDTKEEGALALLPELVRQVRAQEVTEAVPPEGPKTYKLFLNLGMRLGGTILDPVDPSFDVAGFRAKDLFPKLEVLVEEAKGLQKGGEGLKNPLVLVDGKGEKHVISDVGDLEFERIAA